MISLFTLMILAMPSIAAAASETYAWSDATNNTIVASGGPYSATVNFQKQSDSSFTASNIAINCAGGGTGISSGVSKITQVNGNSTYQIDNTGLTSPPACNVPDFTAQFSVQAAASSNTSSTPSSASTCSQGSISWSVCPVLDNISGSISNLARDILVPLLEINNISSRSTPTLYQAWAHIRDFADVLFILIFFVIIFGTLTEQDLGGMSRYHIKTIWPRLIIAAILVQFSFLFSGVIIDIGNVLGGGIQGLIYSVTNPTAQANPANIIGTLVAGSVGVLAGAGAIAILASWTVAIPLIVSLLISLLVGFLTLGARFLIIAVLIVISPLAMAAWVLPNTENLFHAWSKTFIRLILMYPIVIGVISLAGVVNEILPFGSATTASGVGATAVAIIKPLIVIAAFLSIPAAFKYAGRSMEAVSGLINRAGQKGQTGLRNSSIWQQGVDERKRRQVSQMVRFVNSDSIKGLNSKGRTGRAAAGALTYGAGLAMLNAPKDKRSLERMSSSLMRNAKKDLESMDEATIGNLHRVSKAFAGPDLAKRKTERESLKKDAPNLFQLASTRTGREAVVSRLAELGFSDMDTVQSYASAPKRGNIMSTSNNPQGEYAALLRQIGKETGAKPAIAGRLSQAKKNYEVKDAGGNIIRTESRAMGDLDLNGVSKGIRRITPKDFGDRHSMENFRVMGTRTSTNPAMVKSAVEMAKLYAENLNRNVVVKAMDATDPRSATSLEARIEWMKNVQINSDIFKRYNPDILSLSAANLEVDPDLTNNLLQVMGISSSPSILVLSSKGRANVVRDWMQGQTYDPYFDYETSGKLI